VILQLVSIACSVVSYYTSHAFVEHHIGVFVRDAVTAFRVSVGLIVLIEAVKMIAAIPLLIRLVQLKGVNWLVLLIVAGCFAGSAIASYEGGEIEVVQNAAPELVNTDSIRVYYDAQLAQMLNEQKEYTTNKKYQTRDGVVFLRVMKDHVKPLTAEITRIRNLRDTRIQSADSHNKAIKDNHHEYIHADAKTMALIALIADLFKILIALATAWFFVSCKRDKDILDGKHDQQELQQNTPAKQVVIKPFQTTQQAAINTSKQPSNKKKSTELQKARGSLSVYRKRVEKYRSEGKIERADANQATADYWEKEVKRLSK
jgi:hypothetical protein